MIHLTGIKKTFPLKGQEIQALKGINLTIEEGSFVSIMGPSGSGKSTLLNILGCLDNVIENIQLPLLYQKVSLKDNLPFATELAALVGLENRLDHKPNELSGGQQQRVAIARSLINDPLMILADEPTGNLDSTTEQEIMKPTIKR